MRAEGALKESPSRIVRSEPLLEVVGLQKTFRVKRRLAAPPREVSFLLMASLADAAQGETRRRGRRIRFRQVDLGSHDPAAHRNLSTVPSGSAIRSRHCVGRSVAPCAAQLQLLFPGSVCEPRIPARKSAMPSRAGPRAYVTSRAEATD